jgi:hypothetical protein
VIERRKIELNLVEKQYGELRVGSDFSWFIVNAWKLPTGWNKSTTALLVIIPPGYPATPPDNFYTDQDLRPASGGEPGNASGALDHDGARWRQFSYHVEAGDWRPGADPLKGHNLLTFLIGIGGRMSEAS